MIRALVSGALLAAVAAPVLAQVDLPFRSNREMRQELGGTGAQTGVVGNGDTAPHDPLLRVSFPETVAVPGQPLSLRLTVLVPTFMPDPPIWPTLELPNLLVRLPEGSINPTGERVGSATWAGITRHYRISPMVPGAFALPPQDIVVTYVDPETNQPVQTTLTTDALSFAGAVPAGAEQLDPFIAAEVLELTQDIEGDASAMVPGDSVVRTVTARIEGTSPMFLPGLIPTSTMQGVAAYPDEPVVEESDDRGVPSGMRTESVTLVAQGGGSGEMPAVSIDWYNLQSGKVETASVDGIAVSVEGPTARTAAPRDWRAIGIAALAGLVVLGLVSWLAPRIVRPLRRWLRARREARLASESHAYAVLRRVVSRKDHARLYPALDDWVSRVAGPDPRRDLRIAGPLMRIGAARYGRSGPGDTDAAWRALLAALPEARRAARPAGTHARLPPLNPSGRPPASHVTAGA